jgi:hypothetical protein
MSEQVNSGNGGKTQEFANTPADIAKYCSGADQSGRGYKCNCPICGRHSLSISYGQKYAILIQCWYCRDCGLNDGYTEQRAHFVELGLLEAKPKYEKFNRQQYEEHHAQKRKYANELWPRLLPLTTECHATRYLHARGLQAFVNHPALRCHETAGHLSGTIRPILAARMWHIHHGLSAVQVTYLQWGNDDRDRDLKPGKQTFGSAHGAGVWINAPRADDWIVVGEGLETTLSALLLMDARCGVACLGTNFRDLVLPSCARKVIIAADNDDSGRDASAYTTKIWRAQGLNVRIVLPDREGDDFNDVLRSMT